ncbi:MAG TPA: ABC transporter permease [Burkholderiales bacterium]|nr:ABC transporter permease [Burkholderiales bacterium]
MIWSILAMALREIRRHKMRSGLTTLGIVIGVASVVALVTLGESSSAKVRADMASMGNNLLQVLPGSARRGPARSTARPFTIEDAQAIAREVGDAGLVAPVVTHGATAVAGHANHMTTVWGTTETYLAVRGFQIERGRMLTEMEHGAGVCVLGATVRKQLFGEDDPLGQRLRVGGVPCQVIGTLAPKGANAWGSDQDDLILMPLRTVQRRLRGNTEVGAVMVSVRSEAAIPRVKSQLESLMRERRKIRPGQEADFFVHDMKEVAEAMQSVTGTMTALLGAIAAVSLLVGGIGIMNIMLVSVTERTREIGIRMAIGATSGEVLLQFLLEAVALSLLGGLAGVLLGMLASFGFARALGLPPVLVPWIVGVAFLFSAAVGVGFGFFPARKAALLHPIDALRHE